MKKSLLWLIIFFVFFTTYSPKFNPNSNFNFNIQEIIIENNEVLETDEIKKKLNFLREMNLFFLNKEKIEKNLRSISFIESLSIKKIYPHKLKITIEEKKPIAIIQNKKKKFYISNKGDVIKYKYIEIYKNLPTMSTRIF